MKKYLIIAACSLFFQGVKAQKLVNIATQRFEEKVTYQTGDVLQLELEKVQVSIIGKEQGFYTFEIVLRSRHKDQEQAIKELGYLKYQLKKTGDTIHFFNDFVTGETFQKVQGVLNIALKITAPASSPLMIENAYGKTYIRNISAPIDLKGKFVETKVSECKGALNVVSAFGEHQINEYQGNITLDLSRVDLVGNEINGEVKGKTSYGSIHINELSTKNFEITSRRTAFTLALTETSLQEYSFDLFTQLGHILIEGTINEKASNQWKYQGSTDSNIKIKTTYSPIVIRDQSLNASKK